MHPQALDAGVSMRALERRDRVVLVIHAASGLLIVTVGELAAFYFDLANRVGIRPVVVRGIVFLGLTTLLWSMLLRANRATVSHLLEELRNGYESILVAYDSAVSLKDAYTGGHGRRVAAGAARIAAVMGLTPGEVKDVREAALLHDLGKIGAPDAILTKAAPLNAGEVALMRNHPRAGAAILEGIPALRRHAPAVRHHHESLDGTGYPDGLRGNDIPLQARIIAVADVWDALTSDRSYRRALAPRDASAEMEKLSGSQLDPAIVAALRASMAAGAPSGRDIGRAAIAAASNAGSNR